MKLLYSTVFILALYMNVQAQNNLSLAPEVGHMMPDFIFKEVKYHTTPTIAISDFRGKWLIIDCWNRLCGACLESMPLTDSLQRAFSDRVKFLLVGYTGSQYTNYQQPPDDRKIRKLYEANKNRMNLDLSIAYDSTFFHQFQIGPCPYIIIISPQGIVKGITYKLSGNELQNILDGQSVILRKAYRKNQKEDL